jgi:hypothetical protein
LSVSQIALPLPHPQQAGRAASQAASWSERAADQGQFHVPEPEELWLPPHQQLHQHKQQHHQQQHVKWLEDVSSSTENCDIPHSVHQYHTQQQQRSSVLHPTSDFRGKHSPSGSLDGRMSQFGGAAASAAAAFSSVLASSADVQQRSSRWVTGSNSSPVKDFTESSDGGDVSEDKLSTARLVRMLHGLHRLVT